MEKTFLAGILALSFTSVCLRASSRLLLCGDGEKARRAMLIHGVDTVKLPPRARPDEK
jgi:hypothetical protein